MVVVKKLTDSDLSFESDGRISVRGHQKGFKGLLIIGRVSCPYCKKAYDMCDKLASSNGDTSPVYIVDLQNPACASTVKKYNPQGVPSFHRVNRVGRIDDLEYQVDFQNEVNFLSAIRRT